jgi:pyruvate/2-oxoacid:ferredoxin oxidoreductase beta subunit
MASTSLPPTFVATVASLHRVRDQLDSALAAAVAHDGPAMVEVIGDPDLV